MRKNVMKIGRKKQKEKAVAELQYNTRWVKQTSPTH
jgi:hypothetical protein